MIAIRVDGNVNIGIGHIMRCMSIASALIKEGVDVLFITCDDRAEDIILKNGYKIEKVNGLYNELNKQIEETTNLLKKYSINKILIDSYYITSDYIDGISKCSKIILLGSMKKEFKNIDMIINYSCTYDKDFYNKKYENVKFLLGPKYTPLKEEFGKCKYKVKKSVNNILVTTGGTQKNRMCYGILKNILDLGFDGKCTIVASGKSKEVEELINYASMYKNVTVMIDINNMAEIMTQNDLIITAAGTTMYECCALGIPSITFALVEEQEADGLKLMQLTDMRYCGSVEKSGRELILSKINEEIINMYEYNIRNDISEKMKNIIDGKGNRYIAMEMINL